MRFDDLSIRDLLTSIAGKTPTPGGGAVASVTAALAAALAQMVANYSIGKKSLAAHDSKNETVLSSMLALMNKSLNLTQGDALAYSKLNELMKLDKNDARRKREFGTAVEGAISAPQAVLDASLEMLNVMQGMVGTTNAMLKSDLAIAAVLAEAAARSAAWNVRINLPLLEDHATGDRIEASLGQSLKKASKMCGAIEEACAVRE